jgi:peptidoglycan/xylan/chitin deacetylase (PgdA/CDA1 family)
VQNKFQVLTLSDAITYLQSDVPARNTVVITIDDGYKSFYEHGLPLLRQYGLPATLFINTETVGGMDYMDWADLRKASSDNVEIGNHTHSHPYFLNVPAARRYQSLREEVGLSQALIMKHLDLEPQVFSYPYGEFDEGMENEVRDAGFIGAVAQNSGVILQGSNLYRCPRFPMPEAYARVEKFIEKAGMRALVVTDTSAGLFAPMGSGRPELTITFRGDDLRLPQLQCFVQGSRCSVKVVGQEGDRVTITVQAEQSILSRRRTLYTITVPDAAGTWHWYSHLWINEKVK